MQDALDSLLAELTDRVASGEPIDVDSLPRALLDQPEVQALLRLACVAEALDRNQSAPEVAAAPPATIGPWRILRLLGQGGMGEVWLGQRADPTVEQHVAIKRVRGARGSFVRRLLAERRILARLSHPCIARFIDAGIDADSQPWMALEYVDGEDLATWCDRQRPDLATRLHLFLRVAEAVDHAHRLLVVHRDLKPANVLVDANGQPHLLDFGIAKLLDEEAGETTLAALTPAWAAPEQLRGEPVSTATDVYALGLLLCRLLAGGLPPSRARGDLGALVAGLDDEASARPSRIALQASDLPYPAQRLQGDLDAIVLKALRADPAARYPSVAALAEDVQRHLDARPVQARTATRRYRLSRFVRRHRGMLAVAGVAALAVLISLGVAVDQALHARAEAERANLQAQSAAEQAERAAGALRFLLGVFAPADPFTRASSETPSVDAAFAEALERLDKDFSAAPLLAMDLHRALGSIQGRRGEVDAAAQRLDRAITLAETHRPASGELALALLARAELHAQQGGFDAARPLVERAVALLRPLAAVQPIELGEALFMQSNLDAVAGDLDAAEAKAREANALHAAHLPPGDFRHAVARYNLGILLRHRARNDEARPLMDEAVRLAEAAYGPDAASLVYMLDGLRSVAHAQGDKATERAAAERMLAVAEARLPAEHPLHADALSEAGNLRLREDQDPEGERMLREAAAIFSGHGHPYEARAWRLLGMSRNLQGEWAQALDALDSGQQSCARIGPAYAECLSIAAERITSLARLGRGNDALSASQALDALIASEGAQGADTALMADEARAEALAASGRLAEALPLFDALISAYGQRYGNEHPIVRTLQTRRAELAGAG